LLAVGQGVALPSNYATLTGVIWLAVLVTQGIRSNIAALLAGISFTVLPGLAQAYLPVWVGQFPPILFGLGAVAVALNPDGVLAMQSRKIRTVVVKMRGRGPRKVRDDPVGTDHTVAVRVRP
jgi:branched-chain amino acid transport system permease protein